MIADRPEERPASAPERPSPGEGLEVAALGPTPGTPSVVVGIDGSASSWDAYWWAYGEARRLSGRLLAVYVSPVASASLAAASTASGVAVLDHHSVERTIVEQAEHLREEIRRCCAQEHGVRVTFVHARGTAGGELLRISEMVNADVLVVGRSEKARHQFAGSLGRHLISKRGAPVVVVVP
jgi:K+-sensing histidine kinase KdpD